MSVKTEATKSDVGEFQVGEGKVVNFVSVISNVLV
jgi:hypothetical protein